MMKNKKLLKRLIIALMIVTAVLIFFSFMSDPYYNFKDTKYAAFSAEDDGTKAFRLSVEKYGKAHGFDTRIFTKYARFLPENCVAVSINPDLMIINKGYESNAIKNWVSAGNTYIIFSSNVKNILPGIFSTDNNLKQESNDMFRVDIGRGRIILYTNANDLTNEAIKKNSQFAAEMIVTIGDLGYKNVVFNEFHHGVQKGSILQDILGTGVYLFIIELLLGTVLFFISKSVRFGSPVMVTETVKRLENENVYALAGIYERTKSLNIVLEVHMESLLTDVSRYLGCFGSAKPDLQELKDHVRHDRILADMGLPDVINEYDSFMQGKQMSKRAINNLISKIELIRREL